MQTEKFIALIKAVVFFTRNYNTKGQADIPEVLLIKQLSSFQLCQKTFWQVNWKLFQTHNRSVIQLLWCLLCYGTGTTTVMLPWLSSALLEVLNTTLGLQKEFFIKTNFRAKKGLTGPLSEEWKKYLKGHLSNQYLLSLIYPTHFGDFSFATILSKQIPGQLKSQLKIKRAWVDLGLHPREGNFLTQLRVPRKEALQAEREYKRETAWRGWYCSTAGGKEKPGKLRSFCHTWCCDAGQGWAALGVYYKRLCDIRCICKAESSQQGKAMWTAATFTCSTVCQSILSIPHVPAELVSCSCQFMKIMCYYARLKDNIQETWMSFFLITNNAKTTKRVSACVLKHSMLPTNYFYGFSLSPPLKAKNKSAVFSLGLATELYLHCCFTEAAPKHPGPHSL